MSSQRFPPEPPQRGPDDTAPFTPISPEPHYAQPTVPVRRSGGGAGGLSIALAVAVLIAGCGVSFAAGRATAPVVASGAAAGAIDDPAGGLATGAPSTGAGTAPGGGLPNANGQPNGNGGGGDTNGGEAFGRGGSFGGPSIQGTVESVSGNSVTVSLANGASVRVGLGPSTSYHQQTSGSQADLAAGKTVILRVNGRLGADDQQGGGTLGTATDVTVVP